MQGAVTVKFSIILLTCLLAANSALSADAEPQFSAAAIRAHVAFLPHDLLEGRETDIDERPLWIEGDFFGDVFASGQRRAPK